VSFPIYFSAPSSHDEVRNLFAIDYLKEHPDTTTAEFKKVFDNLDDVTCKGRIKFITLVFGIDNAFRAIF
jgi:hypothetical protein